ncbi:hypothetical protein FB451DRAFT_1240363 [Mycena latifolia]|nr:hypothetical protein FB451DRAFT_1295600 [Mycena latifolia]KAJ7478998.1 hypothetical protein FB451DRAFT_1240363 [Mycena latifolia]
MPTFPVPASVTRDADSTPLFDIATTIGALEISVLVALFLGGIVMVQVWLYFQKSFRDHWGLKVLVGVTWVLDLGHTIALCHTLYTITVTQYGQLEKLIIPPLSLDTSILISGFIGPLEQGWFTYRLYKLSNRLTLALFCTLLAGARFVGIIRLSAIALHAYPLPEYTVRAGWLIEAIVIVSATLDTVLVTALCFYLSSWRRDQSRGVQKILTQIMTWSVETGSMTIIGALGLLITFLTMPNNFVYIGFFAVIPKLFSNALLLSLNARERFAQLIRDTSQPVRAPLSRPTVPLVGHAGSVQFRTHRFEECIEIDDGMSMDIAGFGQRKPDSCERYKEP